MTSVGMASINQFEQYRPRRSIAAQLVCLAGALCLWVWSLQSVNPDAIDDFGLIRVLPLGIWLAYALLVLGFTINMAGVAFNTTLARLNLLGLIVLLHGTPAIAYGTLRYSWAWKHLGIVDYIQRHHALDTTADFLAVYHNWPGFFVLAAQAASALGLRAIDLVDVARFFPLLLNIAYLTVLPVLFAQLSSDRRVIWAASAFFIVANWVGQDYFSPQGVAFLLYLLALTLCLGPLATQAPSPASARSFTSQGFAQVGRWVTSGMPSPIKVFPLARVGATLLLFGVIMLMTTMHQLTPIVLISAMAGLVLLSRLSIFFLLFAIAAELGWVFYFASPFTAAVFPEVLAEFGNTAGTALDKMADLTRVSQGQYWVSAAARGLTGVVALTGLLGGLYRLFTGRRDGLAAWLVLAPFPLLVATSYGGEILYRVYFFALPGFCFFTGALFGSCSSPLRTRLSAAIFAGLLSLLIPAFILANNGKDRQYRFTPAEVEAALWLYKNAPPGSLLIEGSRSYPSQFLNYENFAYVPISEESGEAQSEILNDPAGVLGRWLEQSENGGFVILTQSQRASIEDLGIMPPGAFDTIAQALLASPRFTLVKANAQAQVFALHPSSEMFGPWTQ